MNKNELQKELALLLRKVTELETKIGKMSDKPVGCMPMVDKPSENTTVWFLTTSGEDHHTPWNDREFNDACLSIGNCYESREIAKLASLRKKLQFREYQAAMQSWGSEQIDWKNPKQNKYFSFYEHLQEKVSVGTRSTAQTANVNYFYTETRLQTFIDSLTKDEQKLLWAGE